jgi:6-phosphogluconolactonase (cycloisomerase 2 family)
MFTHTPHRLRTGSALTVLAFLLAGCGGSGGGGGKRPPVALSYADSAPTYDLCGDITPNTPSHAGGVATAYSIQPALPAGLSFDTTTGVISGAPSAISASATYTVVASNAYGQASTDLTLEVAHELPTGLEYPDLAQELGRGVFVELVPQLAAGYGTTWSVSGGALPAGLALDPATGIISGVPSALQTSNFSITVEDCAAATTFDSFVADIVPPYTRGACVVDSATGTVRAFVRTPATGAMLHHGKQWSDDGVSQVAVHPWNHLVFTAADGVISVLRSDTRSLELTTSGESVSIGATTITDLACTNDGRFLFATSVLGLVHGFSIDTTSGELTPTPIASVSTGASPVQIAIDTSDSWLYVANQGDDTISAFEIDSLDGSLTSLGATASGDGVRALAFNSDSSRLYAACATATNLYGYEVDALSGALTPSAWSPASIAASGVSAIAIRPDDSVLYAGFEAAALLRAFELDALTGEPTDALFANVTARSNTRQIAIDPRDGHLYSAHGGGELQSWSIGVSGALSAASVGVTQVGAEATEFALVFGHGEWRPTTRSVYVTSLATDGVWEYAFDSLTGALTANSGTPIATGINPQTISVHRFADRAIVAHRSPGTQNALSVHHLDYDGSLGAGSGFGQSTDNVGFDLERSGQFGYMVRNGSNNNTAVLTSYAFDAVTAGLDVLGTSSFSANAWPPSVDPSGSLIVVPDSGADQLDLFEIDPITGVASYSGSVSTGGSDPFRAVFDPTGRFVYAAHLGSDSIAAFSVDLANLTLTPLAGSPFATAVTPLVMGIGTNGTALMIADTAQGQWQYFTIDQDPSSLAADGSLTSAGTGTQAGMALLRFDISDTHILWVLSGTNRIRSSPITAPGVLGAPISDLAVGAQITSMALRTR